MTETDSFVNKVSLIFDTLNFDFRRSEWVVWWDCWLWVPRL